MKRKALALALGLCTVLAGFGSLIPATGTYAAESENAIEFSGEAHEWESILFDAVKKNSDLDSLMAVSDGEYLYVGCSAKRMGDEFSVYISNGEKTDSTDKTDLWSDAGSIVYVLSSEGLLYAFTNGEKAKDGVKVDGFYKGADGFEAKISLDKIGGLKNEYKVGMEAEGEYLPDEGAKLLTVTPPVIGTAPAITVDGDPADWKGVEPLAVGEGSLGDIYAFRDNEKLYVMTYISGVTDPESSASYTTSFFIDTDQNQKTGFLHSGYAAHSTGDFLIQDWCSYGPDQSLDIFFTDESVTLEWNMKQQSVEGYEKVFKATKTLGVYCAEYMVPIATLKEVTPKVSDTLYVCIDRNDCQTDEETFERLTPEGFTPARDTENGTFACVPKYNITFDLSFEDSTMDDWEGICNKVKHESSTNLCAVKGAERLYTIVYGNGDMSTDVVYSIATDATGFKYGERNGVSYVVKKGRLYSVVGDNKLSDDSVAVYQYYDSDYVLMSVYNESMGNPAELKVYVNANGGEYMLPEEGFLEVKETITEKRDPDRFYPTENFEEYNNPYKGWVGWADINEGEVEKIAVDYNLVYVDIKWSEIEKTKGVYDFDAIEKQYQFDKWHGAGRRMVLRFVMDNPNYIADNPDIERMDIPQWLYEELKEENAEGEGAGVFYKGETILSLLGGVGFSPNYKSPKLLEYHRNVIKALAERYDNPDICAYVEVGSLGHWAEFHTWPTGSGEFPDPPLAQEYMQPYVDYFHNVKVGIRKPYPLAAENGWGLYNDVFGVTPDGATPTFLEWAATGNTDMPGAEDEDIWNSAMPEWWMWNYSGGEFADGDFRTNALDENICAVLKQIRDSHTTWLGPCSACDIKVGDPDYDKYIYNVEVMLKNMGYRYNLASITKKETMDAGESVPLSLEWKNSGVAPIYYCVPVTVYLVNEKGATVAEAPIETCTDEWLPGISEVETELKVPENLASGEYELCVRMAADAEEKNFINLAMEGKREDGGYSLYKVNVKGKETASSNASSVSSPASSVSAETKAPEKEKNKFPVIPVAVGGVLFVAAVTAVTLIIKKKQK
ncbi:MAG: DUF4832 domain-containing protein [Lachnospiraceae bacterium]|nr:DUF4832 domain-containing protein [Lachnospiraceae bacterium]